MHDFRKLRVWRDARELAVDVHEIVRRFPKSDRQVLSSQMRRSSLSISATIAEGCGKDSNAETKRYLQMAAASASETANHLIAAGDLKFIPVHEAERDAERASILNRQIRALARKLPP